MDSPEDSYIDPFEIVSEETLNELETVIGSLVTNAPPEAFTSEGQVNVGRLVEIGFDFIEVRSLVPGHDDKIISIGASCIATTSGQIIAESYGVSTTPITDDELGIPNTTALSITNLGLDYYTNEKATYMDDVVDSENIYEQSATKLLEALSDVEYYSYVPKHETADDLVKHIDKRFEQTEDQPNSLLLGITNNSGPLHVVRQAAKKQQQNQPIIEIFAYHTPSKNVRRDARLEDNLLEIGPVAKYIISETMHGNIGVKSILKQDLIKDAPVPVREKEVIDLASAISSAALITRPSAIKKSAN